MPDPIAASTEARLAQALRALALPGRAEQEKRYQKSHWEHWGVPLPSMDVAIKEALGELSQEQSLCLCRRLWREPVWDLKIVAGRILTRKSIALDARVWAFVTERLIDFDGWAVADNLATAASRYLVEDPGRLDAVEAWIENTHLWTRRAALVFTLPWAKEKRDPERMLGRAARLADDPEWFIQKGDRLVAANLSKRDPRRVRGFLTEHGEKLRGVAKREVTKYLES
jgi:3-methyladenine DNA glycosylase AlkD